MVVESCNFCESQDDFIIRIFEEVKNNPEKIIVDIYMRAGNQLIFEAVNWEGLNSKMCKGIWEKHMIDCEYCPVCGRKLTYSGIRH